MAKVYGAPESIVGPTIEDFSCMDGYAVKAATYEEQIANYCKNEGSGDSKGKAISFPVGDGKAVYIVFDNKTLIHVDTYDCWSITEAHARGLRKADIEKLANRVPFGSLISNA
jgi:hypothetical protein